VTESKRAGSTSTDFYSDSIERMCLENLRRSFDPTAGLWTRQLRAGTWGSTLATEDLTGTCICLVGLDRAGIDTAELAMDPQHILRQAAGRLRAHGYAGGTGLLIWANAVHNGKSLEELLRLAGQDLTDTKDFVATLTSMEASWLLSGLLHEFRRAPEERTRGHVNAVLEHMCDRLDRTGSGLMPHAVAGAPLRHRLRRHLPNFADQIYSLQALAFASILVDSAPAFKRAEALGARLIDLQGSLGQWWWHYDSRTGAVAGRYPVYSVHQHAMAPMALLALGAAARAKGKEADIKVAIDASYGWLTRNELNIDLVDVAAGTIWRDIEPQGDRVRSHAERVLAALGLGRVSVARDAKLGLNRETRPYEWAWCLYAASIATGRPGGEVHVV
jgi:hypothetical protein